MHWFGVIILVLCMTSVSVLYGELMKCCKQNHVFQKNNGIFRCSKYPTNRAYIFTNNTDFLQNNTDGQCVEFFGNFYVFNINNNSVSQSQLIEETIYKKCCPLNYEYNTELHACEKIENVEQYHIDEKYIKIGLPECKIIKDEIIKNSTENYYRSNINSCIDRSKNGTFVSRKCIKDAIEICSKIKCIKKCCPDGQRFLRRDYQWQCVEGYQGINLTAIAVRGRTEFPKEPFAIITTSYLDVFLLDEKHYPPFLDRKGIFSYKIPARNTSNEYCVEYINTPKKGYYFFLHMNRDKLEYIYYSYLFLVSSAFLGLTIVIFFLLNEVEKVFGKILVNYVLAMLLWYVDLAYMYTVQPEGQCLTAAFIFIFARTATFVWSNIMCWDICRTFRSIRGYNDTFKKSNNIKKIIIYCVYGWGIPLALTLMNIFYKIGPKPLSDHNQPYQTSESLQSSKPPRAIPIVVQTFCFFDIVQKNYSSLWFVDSFIILILLTNILLFMKTAMHCMKVKNEINQINHDGDKKEMFQRIMTKFYLVLKLFLTMGLTLTIFILEAVVTFMSIKGKITQNINRVSHIINAAQGVFIFLIFICNQQIYKTISKKFEILNASCIGSTDSVATQTSNLSGQNSTNSQQNSDAPEIYKKATK